MNLLERYLQAIRFLLPRRGQDDIIRELSENVRSQMEEREEELGRPLTEDEEAEILRRHGHPIAVAGQYRNRQQLIGPLFFSMYVLTLKLGLVAAFVVTVVIAAGSAVLHGEPGRRMLEAFLSFPARALMVFAWTTLGFAGLDFVQSRYPLACKWDPRKLPKVIRPQEHLSRVHSICEFAITLACLVWLLLIPASPFLLFGPGAAIFDFAPVWRIVYGPLILFTLAAAVISFNDVIRPYWTPGRSLVKIVVQGSVLLVAAVLLRAGEWVVAKPFVNVADPASMKRLVEIANASFGIGLLVTSVIALIEIGREVIRWRSHARLRALPEGAPANSSVEQGW